MDESFEPAGSLDRLYRTQPFNISKVLSSPPTSDHDPTPISKEPSLLFSNRSISKYEMEFNLKYNSRLTEENKVKPEVSLVEEELDGLSKLF